MCYIKNVSKWLTLTEEYNDLIIEKTNKLVLLTKLKIRASEHVGKIKTDNDTLTSFFIKMKKQLDHFTFTCGKENTKLFEICITTLQLEFSVISILHFNQLQSQLACVRNYFSQLIKFTNEVKDINKKLEDLEVWLQRLLVEWPEYI